MDLSSLTSTVIGKVSLWVIGILVVVIAGLSVQVLVVSGERNVLEQTIKTKEAEIAGKVKDVAFMKAWMARDKLDAVAKDAEYNRTMAAKPAFITSIKYVPTGDKCVDYDGIINEARKNKQESMQ